jgi:predicted transcriptional regulator
MAMTLRLSDEDTAALRAAAEREGRSMQEVVRIAVHEYVTRRTERRDAALATIVSEDADLLDRLGSV